MIKVWLILLLCEVTNVSNCHNVRLTTEENASEFSVAACMNTAQYLASQYLEDKPNQKFMGWRCVRSDAPDLDTVLGGVPL